MSDPLDNVYGTEDEREVADREPVMLPTKYYRILTVLWQKEPEKQVAVTFRRVDEAGGNDIDETAVFASAAFQQYRQRMPQAGEDLGDQEENAAYEALVAKGKIPADAAIV